MKPFSVSILTQEKKIYEGEIVSLIAPASLGYLGVLADHIPFVSNLKAGNIILTSDHGNAPLVFHSHGKGFLEVLNNKATLLLDSVEA